MNTRRKRRLYFILILVSTLLFATTLVMIALKDNINLFYTPSEIKIAKIDPKRRLRIGGMVEKGSVKQIHAADPLEIRFVVTDFHESMTVYYRGILPDLFKEGQGIVVGGYLSDLDRDRLTADEVLAKHDENYEPPRINNRAS